jgi:hypothetical protein
MKNDVVLTEEAALAKAWCGQKAGRRSDIEAEAKKHP